MKAVLSHQKTLSTGVPIWIGTDLVLLPHGYIGFPQADIDEDVPDDPHVIVLQFPNTGIGGYAIQEEGIIADLCRVFPMWRLDHIHQLGFLQAPYYREHFMRDLLSKGSRYLHSHDVFVIARLIGVNLRLSRILQNNLDTAALLHDIQTPAGGDSLMLVDYANLSEERNFWLIFEQADWSEVRERYSLDPQMIIEAVNGKGLLGEILDIADKLAYVARDLYLTMHQIHAGASRGMHGLLMLERLGKEFTEACSIWDSIELVDGKLVFTDVRRLVTFLKIRTLLFRELYYSPESRFGEYMMSRIFGKVLYNKGILTRDNLLKMGDEELIWLFDKHFGSGLILDVCSSEYTRCGLFETVKEAKGFLKGLKRRGITFAFIDDDRKGIKPGVHFLVLTLRGPLPLSQAYPVAAAKLDKMARLDPRMVRVYYLDGDPKLPRDKLESLKRSFANKWPDRAYEWCRSAISTASQQLRSILKKLRALFSKTAAP